MDSLPKVQLYNIGHDAAEEINQVAKYPELINEYRNELLKVINDGRSTQGRKLQNDNVADWEQLEHISGHKIITITM